MDINVNNTLFTGKQLFHLTTVDSTNLYAKSYIAKSSPIDGTVILADEQTAGRGQMGNIWQAASGKNLTFSIVYKTNFLLAKEQYWLTMAVSLAVRAAVEKLLIECHSPSITRIKWPNDVYVDDKKICGILIENTIQGSFLNYSIIGVGLNVNQINFPNNIQATSLQLLTKMETNRIDFFKNSLASVEHFYLLLKSKKFEQLKKEYIESLYQYNVVSKYKKEEQVFEGKIIDVDEIGNLVLETAAKNLKFGFKEISFVV